MEPLAPKPSPAGRRLALGAFGALLWQHDGGGRSYLSAGKVARILEARDAGPPDAAAAALAALGLSPQDAAFVQALELGAGAGSTHPSRPERQRRYGGFRVRAAAAAAAHGTAVPPVTPPSGAGSPPHPGLQQPT